MVIITMKLININMNIIISIVKRSMIIIPIETLFTIIATPTVLWSYIGHYIGYIVTIIATPTVELYRLS